ncbi:MAG TPA: class I SAM-dependent rRNA methyltransferase, partial [Deinococcales bacterium]|nr:class I SAM-dependent rRNA methyltransferase [Deinococcales bacterium]
MTVTLKPGRERRLQNFHPWIFRDDVADADPSEPGEVVNVTATGGGFVAQAYWNETSNIPGR